MKLCIQERLFEAYKYPYQIDSFLFSFEYLDRKILGESYIKYHYSKLNKNSFRLFFNPLRLGYSNFESIDIIPALFKL